jgi:hypothetical protein
MADPARATPAETQCALDRFGAALSALRFLPGTAHAEQWNVRREGCRRLFLGKVRLEASCGSSPVKLVVAGGTNVGKSTLFNRILGETVSATSPLARFTKSAVLYVHAERHPATVPPEFLPAYPRAVSGEDAQPVGGSPSSLRPTATAPAPAPCPPPKTSSVSPTASSSSPRRRSTTTRSASST